MLSFGYAEKVIFSVFGGRHQGEEELRGYLKSPGRLHGY
jgi:hypothetical protein